MTLELQHIYRQSDARFIKLLNRVRDNRLDASSIGDLNRRYIENFTPEKGQGYITLTTHNRSADPINETRLSALRGQEYRFNAEVSGEFPEHTYPTPSSLVLKIGAQVMFLRNDISGEKRYYNGKIGKITTISGRRDPHSPAPASLKTSRLVRRMGKYQIQVRRREQGNQGGNHWQIQTISPQTRLGHYHP